MIANFPVHMVRDAARYHFCIFLTSIFDKRPLQSCTLFVMSLTPLPLKQCWKNCRNGTMRHPFKLMMKMTMILIVRDDPKQSSYLFGLVLIPRLGKSTWCILCQFCWKIASSSLRLSLIPCCQPSIAIESWEVDRKWEDLYVRAPAHLFYSDFWIQNVGRVKC